MDLIIGPDGMVRCVYGEELDLQAIGQLHIRRASHVEPDGQGRWWADLSPVGGPRLGPYACRSLALAAEQKWLVRHWLPGAEVSHGVSQGTGGSTQRNGGSHERFSWDLDLGDSCHSCPDVPGLLGHRPRQQQEPGQPDSEDVG